LGKSRRPSFFSWPEVTIVQVIKRHMQAVWQIEWRVAQGYVEKIAGQLISSQGCGVINTAKCSQTCEVDRPKLCKMVKKMLNI
jgi:hypothetical protein